MAEQTRLSWFDRLRRATIWRLEFFIDDKIEALKYRLYCKLYVWYDCLPPDERDL